MGAFEDFLATCSEEDRGTVATKFPRLKESLTQMDALRVERDQQKTRADNWKTWASENWDADRNLPKGTIVAQEEAAAAAARAADLEAQLAARSTDQMPSFEDVEKYLTGKGFRTAADVETVVKATIEERSKTLVPREENAAVVNNLVTRYAKSAPLIDNHRVEFGESIDNLSYDIPDGKGGVIKAHGMEAVLAMGNVDPSLFDPRKAYDFLVSPRREEIRKTAEAKREVDTKAAIDKARADGIALGKQEVAMGANGPSPTDQGGPSAMGHLQMKKFHKENPDQPDLGDAQLGSGRLTQMGLEALMKQQAGGVQ